MAWKCPDCGYLQRLSFRCKACTKKFDKEITANKIKFLMQKHKYLKDKK